ncbi:SCP2 domain-containing protein [Shimwellia pseudoproteus]|uniref:ubiquinone biosynthesis protein UbiJ n=1 Tax=Shimwellia pseudoproteus TaxID=570012 RepID=UPI0018EE122F|nr:SCP2 domain-containing protein [Shimwellia pseudoproteus]MBJ3815916.1 SCP2 domain-containing protein [Shimwellia pseudoproteus]
MPLVPVITAALEGALNAALYRNRALKAARQRLVGKVLRLEVQHLPGPLVLVFSEQQLDVLGQWESEADCRVTTQLGTLPKLRDRQQLTALIRSGELEVHGDIQVVQNLVALLDLAEFDLAEVLSPWTGDIVAEGISRIIKGGGRFLQRGAARQQRYLAESLTEEWRMAPGPLEVAWFAGEVDALERSAQSLVARLEKLESK